MKVGTDGTLLGAWAHGGRTVLDIGTGTGLIALMMAQRFPQSQVTAIDIDEDAVAQARENVVASPFADRISVVLGDIRNTNHTNGQTLCVNYEAIVVNPPYFIESLECPDDQRTTARHTSSLSYRDLMGAACRLLADDGELSVVIPFDCKARLESEALLHPARRRDAICWPSASTLWSQRRRRECWRRHPANGRRGTRN